MAFVKTVALLAFATALACACDARVFGRDAGEPQLKGIRSCAPAGTLVLRLRDVEPWPIYDSPPRPAQYCATFVLEKVCNPRR